MSRLDGHTSTTTRSRATLRYSRSVRAARRSWRSSRPTRTATGLCPTAAPRAPGAPPGSALPNQTRRSQLRAAGDDGHILTWLYGPEVPAERLIAAGIDLSVSSPDVLGAIVAAAREAGLVRAIHVCVDTGLGREGVQPARLDGLMALIAAAQARGARDARGHLVALRVGGRAGPPDDRHAGAGLPLAPRLVLRHARPRRSRCGTWPTRRRP